MPTWDPELYLRFAERHTRGSHELAACVPAKHPSTIIDLGCGPGNSTGVLAERWPHAAITGFDGSGEMLNKARETYPQHKWVQGDIRQWAEAEEPAYDLVFSSAALHWIADHAALYPRLFARVSEGGTLAVQVPYNWDEPFNRIVDQLDASGKWRKRLPPGGTRTRVRYGAEFYYDLLAPTAADIRLWETRHITPMPGVESIVEWLKGAPVRPILDALSDRADYEGFLDDLTVALKSEYKPRVDGSVLFSSRSLFLIASR